MRFNKDLEPLIDLWARVIKRAIDDIILFSSNSSSLEEEIFDSAYSFIFNDEHLIFIDNYWVAYRCRKCNKFIHEMMSSFSTSYKCADCKSLIRGEDVTVSKLMKGLNRECLAIDLFETLGIEDIEGFRNSVRRKVKEKTGKDI